MVNCMMHEPFYRQGFYLNERLGVYVGWTCHPGSYAECMPATNEEKTVVLVFVGEHFDDGHTKSHQASGLLELYEQDEEKFLATLNGWFAGVLLDLRRSKVILFNDRYGMHRVYYHEEKDAFLFSSEAKTLLKVRPHLRELDMQGLGELIACNCVLENRTIFPKISLLPGAAAWTWEKGGSVAKEMYFNARDWENLPVLDEETFCLQLIETVKTVIPRYFREKGQVGMSLTGGLDSRMIMACLNAAPGELPCYTFGGQKDMLDITIARQVADVCGQMHSVIRLDDSFFADFPYLARKTIYVTDGSLEVSSTHDIFLNRLARSIAPIRVTGKFGSEVIRDHSMFHAGGYNAELFCGDLKSYLSRALSTFSEVKKGHQLSVAVFKDFPWREYNKVAIEQSQSVFRTPYMDNNLVKLMYQAPLGIRSSNLHQRQIIKYLNPKLSSIISDRGYSEQRSLIISKFLELYYYSLFKADYTYVHALPHWLMPIDAMCLSMNGGKPLLGASQKFEHYRIWYGRQLSGFVKEVLLDAKTTRRACFDRKFLEMMVHTHVRGTRNYTNEINKALSLELTYRVFSDGEFGFLA